MAHTLTFAADAIVTGKIYSFQFRALNAKGYSEFSEILSVATAAPPVKANTPTVDYSKSSKTSLFIKWARNSDAPGPGGLITGYTLFMDDGKGGKFVQILDTRGTSPKIAEYLATGLTTSLLYRFKVVAHNYNSLAAGPESDIGSIWAC
jgi:hypothetical protein